jgi:hypothetical protein
MNNKPHGRKKIVFRPAPSLPDKLKPLVKAAIDLAVDRGDDEPGYWTVFRDDVLAIWYQWKLNRLAVRLAGRVVFVLDGDRMVLYIPGEWEQWLGVYVESPV